MSYQYYHLVHKAQATSTLMDRFDRTSTLDGTLMDPRRKPEPAGLGMKGQHLKRDEDEKRACESKKEGNRVLLVADLVRSMGPQITFEGSGWSCFSNRERICIHGSLVQLYQWGSYQTRFT